jgi:hypothetical protein
MQGEVRGGLRGILRDAEGEWGNAGEGEVGTWVEERFAQKDLSRMIGYIYQ